jgi:hypothetical protein
MYEEGDMCGNQFPKAQEEESIKYRRDQYRNSHVAGYSPSNTSHLLEIAGRSILRGHGDGVGTRAR